MTLDFNLEGYSRHRKSQICARRDSTLKLVMGVGHSCSVKGRGGGSSQVRKGLKCQDVWDGGQAGYRQLSQSDKESRAVRRKSDVGMSMIRRVSSMCPGRRLLFIFLKECWDTSLFLNFKIAFPNISSER